MKLLDKINADIARHEVMACYDLDGQLASIEFQAFATSKTNDTPSYSVTNGVAVIKVRGLLVPKADYDYGESITGYNILSDYLAKADNDPLVTDIVLDIDSNGGYVKGLGNVVEQITRLSKPINAYVSGNAYSGGYWLASSTQSITANKDSGIGSIGVMVQHVERSEQLKKEGFKVTTFVSGMWKDFFNPTRPLTEQEAERIQQNTDESASIFFNHVAYQRGLDTTTVASWQGDTFTATKAKELGLIDNIVGKVTTQTTPPITIKTQSISQNPQETNMDLVQALSENGNLKAQVAQKDTELQAKDAKIAQLQQALNEQQACHRQAKIDELAQATGKTFSDDEITAFKAMDDNQFAIVVSLATTKPTLPKGLDIPQATAGANHDTQSLSSKVTAWGNS